MSDSNAHNERLLDLLADRAAGTLGADDARELDRLLAEHPHAEDDSIDLAAAAAAVVMLGEPEAMPDGVRTRVLTGMSAEAGGLRLAGTRPDRAAGVLAWSGWLAAAACLLVAAIVGLSGGPTESEPLPIADARQEFLDTTTDIRTAAWGDWDNPEQPGVTGRVEWSESRQRGYMTFSGLAVNNPTAEQYQLWIIDERGMDQRVSGAIFDCDAESGELVVEIDPSIEIHNAAAFAITIEEPGGTWVSDMSRRVVITALSG